jgi:hypothetical protein
MGKEPDYNDIIRRKWPPVFRDGIKITDHFLGILEISMHGEIEIAAKDLKQMKQLGYIHDDIKDEDDLSEFLVTSVTFREYQAPPLENDGKSDRYVLELS